MASSIYNELDELGALVHRIDARIQKITQMDLERSRKSMEVDLPTV